MDIRGINLSGVNILDKYRVPNAPIIGTATSTGISSATVTFTAPAFNGNQPIISYTAVSTPGNITGTVTQSGSGTITISGLISGTSYTFTVYATNSIGNSTNSDASNQITTSVPSGQAEWSGTGTYTWTVPEGVYSISAVTIGTGANGNNQYSSGGVTYNGNGGNGGKLAYKNNIPVTPGETLNIGVTAATLFNYSYLSRNTTSLCRATNGIYPSGTSVGDAVFAGGVGGTNGSGGGAGGYSGAGGKGGNNSSAGSAGTGGAAGGGGGLNGGGGTGIYGEGASGGTSTTGGKGGSGGNNGTKAGGTYGGGGGGSTGSSPGAGATGAVRIIYPGNERYFPSTRTANE